MLEELVLLIAENFRNSLEGTLLILDDLIEYLNTNQRRFAILTPETFPEWRGGTVLQGIKHLIAAVNMEPDQWQFGKTKVFIKNPESVCSYKVFYCTVGFA